MTPTLPFAAVVIQPSSALPFLPPSPSLLKLHVAPHHHQSRRHAPHRTIPRTAWTWKRINHGASITTSSQQGSKATKARMAGSLIGPPPTTPTPSPLQTNRHHHRTGGSGTVPAARAPCTPLHPLRTVRDSGRSRPGRQLHRNPSSKARSEPLPFPNQ